jgi:transcriptional regulator with XRE-family HTH domain
VITPEQIRAARHLIGWKQQDLAAAARVSIAAIKDIERGTRDPRSSTLNAIEGAFTRAGVIFLEVGDTRSGGRGVRLARGSD